MEPYRGFFQFMEAVQLILALRLDCHVDLGGSDRSCYGSASADGRTWRQIEKEKGGYDMDRVHFVGRLNRGDFLRLLQVPRFIFICPARLFCLGRHLEAMAARCCLVALATSLVEEVVEAGEWPIGGLPLSSENYRPYGVGFGERRASGADRKSRPQNDSRALRDKSVLRAAILYDY